MKCRMHRIKTGTHGQVCFELPETMLEYYKRVLIAGIKMGDWYDVSIDVPKKKRSTGPHSQNKHLNGHITQIAMETGNDFDMIKMVVKLKAIDQGYPYETLPTGDRWPQSESKASTVECGLLIEVAHQLASEYSIRLKEDSDDML